MQQTTAHPSCKLVLPLILVSEWKCPCRVTGPTASLGKLRPGGGSEPAKGIQHSHSGVSLQLCLTQTGVLISAVSTVTLWTSYLALGSPSATQMKARASSASDFPKKGGPVGQLCGLTPKGATGEDRELKASKGPRQRGRGAGRGPGLHVRLRACRAQPPPA